MIFFSIDHISCTDGKISVGIKIGITFNFSFHRRPIQLLVFIPVGLSSFLRRRQILLGVEVSSSVVTEATSTPNKTCQICRKNYERPTRTNTSNRMGRRWKLKIKVIPILILNKYCNLPMKNIFLRNKKNDLILIFNIIYSGTVVQFI